MTMTPSSPVVVKIGGALLDNADALADFWTNIRHLHETAPVVIVHGGGSRATEVARRLGHEPRIVQGRRVTTDQDLEIVQWTMRGALNAHLVGAAQAEGLRAVGLSGADGGVLRVTKRPPWQIDGELVDFGWVGDVEHVDVHLLETLLASGFVPVVAPLGIDADGRIYNVNADTVARSLAEALQAEQLLFVTETGGVRVSPDSPESPMARCDAATFSAGTSDGWIRGGMRVKLQVAFEALQAGIRDVFILAPDDLLKRSYATQVVP